MVCVLPPPKAVCSWMTGSPPWPLKPLGDLREQQPHALGDEGALEERLRVLVLGRCLARVHGGDVRGELGLLERAFQHVAMRNSDFSPRFHDGSSHNSSNRVRCCGVVGTLTAADSMPVQLVMSSL